MVPKAREDFPEPETPVKATIASRGTSTSMFRRLFSLAPRTCTNGSVASLSTIPGYLIAPGTARRAPSPGLAGTCVRRARNHSRYLTCPCVRFVTVSHFGPARVTHPWGRGAPRRDGWRGGGLRHGRATAGPGGQAQF